MCSQNPDGTITTCVAHEDMVRLTERLTESVEQLSERVVDLEKTIKDGKTKWQNRSTKASTDTMASWADLVATFHFGAFASPNEAPAPEASLGTVTLNWADGSTSTVKIGPADGQNRYRDTDGKRDFWINDWALGQLLYK